MNPYVPLIAALLLIGVAGGSYFAGRSDGRALEKAKQAEVQQIVNESRAAMINAAAKAISDIEVKHVTIREKLQTQVIEKPVYRECRNTPDGMQLLNQALTNGKEPVNNLILPGADPAG